MASYDQIVSRYYLVIRNNPNISANEIGRKYAGTEYGIKKQVRNDIVKNLKEAVKYTKDMKASNAPDDVKKRANKAIYSRAKMTTRKYLKDHPLKPGKKRTTVQDIRKTTFGTGDKPNDFAERY